ncbi:hypothetical protein FA048_06525 [Pedobacter polaris]|uniref:phospholipase D n=1 Tax=Pedobacter polaris TaxID=2571273 RepID=A0A4U1CQC2_9SPHI|nr:phospholipase D-like domain-containing protein [Pedobacter polaris]TKC09864.1 hypothetical protein FA048_06525 [Pedobacter polaris]
MERKAVAFSNNDVITIAWSFDKKPTGCLGFAIYRIDHQGTETPLPNKATFPDTEKDVKDKSSRKFPIQKFYWKDVYARMVADSTQNRLFSYRIVPLQGTPDNLVEMDLGSLVSNVVEISPEVGSNMKAYFNRGLISTQKVANFLDGNLDVDGLRARVEDFEGDARLRNDLSGDMVEALTGFMKKAENSGRIYAGLYELGDKELIMNLVNLGSKLSIILSNSVKKEDDLDREMYIPKGKTKPVYHKKSTDANDSAREKLRAAGAEVYKRNMPDGHIGHNKFLIYVDGADVPKAVLFGSTNWTPTGLCTQTNNTVVIEDEAFAQRYLDYWVQIKADNNAAGEDRKKLQAADFRKWNSSSGSFDIGGAKVQSWFSPNTPKARGTRGPNEAVPVDMTEVIKVIDGAKHAILFLAFYPGAPSLANWTAKAFKKNKNLFVRGMVTNDSASENFYYDLVGGTLPKREKGKYVPVKEDYRVRSADAFNGTKIPEGWRKEILSAGFAIIHDKVMVIDPFSKDCVVVTGSHNLGHKASYDNDENLAIIKGNKRLALAYATHVLDIYDHFSFRINYKKYGNGKNFLETDSEKFMGKYFDSNGAIKNEQLNFWLDGAKKGLS